MLHHSNKLLKLAREAIKAKFTDDKIDYTEYEKFSEKRGIFVTLTINSELRGCIGIVEPVYNLKDGVVHAAQSAAFNDPRFPALSEEELEDVEIEISILTVPKQIEKEIKNIKVGKDGLIIESPFGTGLLLPQVAVEYKWNAQEFLEQTCLKAGLEREDWKQENTKVYTFQVELIKE